MSEASIYCTLCERYKRPQCFNPKRLNRRKRAPDGGPSGRCTRCLSARRIAWRKLHKEKPMPKEKAREYQKRWYDKMMADPERHADYLAKIRARYARNAEQRRAMERAYRSEHRDRFHELARQRREYDTARKRAWRWAHPDRTRAAKKRYELRRALRAAGVLTKAGGA